MQIKLRDQVFALDADGQPVAGTVVAFDGDKALVSPVFYAPTWVPANTCCPVHGGQGTPETHWGTMVPPEQSTPPILTVLTPAAQQPEPVAIKPAAPAEQEHADHQEAAPHQEAVSAAPADHTSPSNEHTAEAAAPDPTADTHAGSPS